MFPDDLKTLFERTRKRLTDFVKRQLWKIYFSVRWSYIGRIGYTMYWKQKEISKEKIQEIYLEVTRTLLQTFQEPWPELFNEGNELLERSRNNFGLDKAREIGTMLSRDFVRRIEKIKLERDAEWHRNSNELKELQLKSSEELRQLKKLKAELEAQLQEEMKKNKELHKFITNQNRMIADLDTQLQILKETNPSRPSPQ